MERRGGRERETWGPDRIEKAKGGVKEKEGGKGTEEDT